MPLVIDARATTVEIGTVLAVNSMIGGDIEWHAGGTFTLLFEPVDGPALALRDAALMSIEAAHASSCSPGYRVAHASAFGGFE